MALGILAQTQQGVASTQYNIGLLYLDTQRNAEAFHSLYKALEIYKLIKNENARNESQYDSSIKYLRRIYRHFQESGAVPPECEAEVAKIKDLLEEE